MRRKKTRPEVSMLVVSIALGLAVLGLATPLVPHADAAVVYVNPGESIQAAINAAANGDEIIVNPGTYVENISFVGDKAITVRSTYLEDENAVTTTIIDGNQSGSVVYFSHAQGEYDSVLAGFTIRNGSGLNIQNPSWYYGGGIYLYDVGSPTISHCIVTGNSGHYGAGIYCISSAPTITNCTISDNVCINNDPMSAGGGIYDAASSSIITDCTIKHNSAKYGAGIHCHATSSTIRRCLIKGNYDKYGNGVGGGLHINLSSINVYDCTFTQNSANAWFGGAINVGCTSGNSINISRCKIYDNSANFGGGIRFTGGSLYLSNCVINNNSANDKGGGISHSGDCLYMTNCTLSNNTAVNDGGGLVTGSSYTFLTNCILWENYPNEIVDNHISYPDKFSIEYCVIQGGYPGVGNFKANPLFVNPAANDYSLQCGSPCIDVGINSHACVDYNNDPITIYAPNIDIDGTSRPQDGGYDIGAYETVSETCVGGSQYACEGDLNTDGAVDLADFVIFKSDFGRYDCPVGP